MKGEAKSICLPNDYVKVILLLQPGIPGCNICLYSVCKRCFLQFELPPVQPITVSIGVDIKDIPKVSDTDFAITLNAYFIVKWHDSRLIVEG